MLSKYTAQKKKYEILMFNKRRHQYKKVLRDDNRKYQIFSTGCRYILSNCFLNTYYQIDWSPLMR